MKKYKSQLSLVKDIGFQDRRKKIFPEDIEKMKQLRDLGLSFKKIAGILGFNYANVYIHLKPNYYSRMKKNLNKRAKIYYRKNREKILLKIRNYYRKRQEMLSGMDLAKYLYEKKPRMTTKNKILEFIKDGKEYKFSQIKAFLNKDYSLFSRFLKELQRDGFIEIIKGKNSKSIKRLK